MENDYINMFYMLRESVWGQFRVSNWVYDENELRIGTADSFTAS